MRTSDCGIVLLVMAHNDQLVDGESPLESVNRLGEEIGVEDAKQDVTLAPDPRVALQRLQIFCFSCQTS